jgi:hypothetical protein
VGRSRAAFDWRKVANLRKTQSLKNEAAWVSLPALANLENYKSLDYLLPIYYQ